MKSMQGSQIKYNAAWRSFWTKVNELSSRQTETRQTEDGEEDEVELVGVPAAETGLTSITDGSQSCECESTDQYKSAGTPRACP